VAVTLVGIFVYAVAGFAHLYFYGSLGVSPEEIGLGYSSILSKAALVLAFTLVISTAVLAAVTLGLFFFIGAVYETERDVRLRIGKRIWSRQGAAILSAIGVTLIVGLIRAPGITLAVMYLIFVLIFSVEGVVKAVKLGKDIEGPSPLWVALAGAMGLLIITAAAIGAGLGLVAYYGDFESVPSVWYWVLGLTFLPPYLVLYFVLPFAYGSWHSRQSRDPGANAERSGSKDRSLRGRWRAASDRTFTSFPHPNKLAVGASLLVLVSTISYVAVLAYADSQRVIDGRPSSSLFSQAVHSPVTCVEFTWLEETKVKNVPTHVLYLGRGDGRVVLYIPAEGSVRLPAASTVLTPCT
jgi:hypothetical protein